MRGNRSPRFSSSRLREADVSAIRRAEKELSSGLRLCDLGQRASAPARRVMLKKARLHAQKVEVLLRKDKSERAGQLRTAALHIDVSCLFEFGEIDKALILGSSFAVIYSSHAGGRDFIVADMCRQLSVFYNVLGDSNRAAAFALECWRRCPAEMRSPRELIVFIDGLIAAGRTQEAVELLKLDRDQVPGRPPDVQNAAIVTRARLGLASCGSDELAAAALDVARGPHLEEWADSLLFVADRLAENGRQPAALDLMSVLSERLRSTGGVSWLAARVDQALAGLYARTGDLRAALARALQAWVVLDELRYCTASQRLRSAVYESFAAARTTALGCAADLGEWRLLSELIEAGRLQSLPASQALTNMAGLITFADSATASDTDQSPSLTIPAPFNYPLDDCWGEHSRELHPPADIYVGGRSALADMRSHIAAQLTYSPRKRTRIDAERIVGSVARPPFLWWATAVAGRRIVWTLHEAGRDGPDGGSISLDEDQQLSDAVTAFLHTYEIPTSLAAFSPIDTVTSLRDCGSREEESLTRSLARLLPAPLHRHLREAGEQPYLLLSAAPELAGIPWPIAQLPDGTRLVERCTLAFLPSLTALSSIRQGKRQNDMPTPFLLSCDCLALRGAERFPVPPQQARMRLGSPYQARQYPGVAPATIANLTGALRTLRPGEPGLAFFRAHCTRETDLPVTERTISIDDLDSIRMRSSRHDPSRSGIALTDGVLSPIALSTLGADGHSPETPLPSHVVFSCCSSAGMAEQSGGESLGLVAASFQAGASRVIATAVDVPSTGFTNIWDDRLLTALGTGNSHFAVLREQQIRALTEWSDRGSGDFMHDSDDNLSPHPAIWAYFQAFGVE
jgi:hypothetical protein